MMIINGVDITKPLVNTSLQGVFWLIVIVYDFCWLLQGGGDGGSWTRVRQHYAHDSTRLESVFGFNLHRPDSQGGLDDLLVFYTCHRNANRCYPLCVRIWVSNQTKGNLCRPKQPLGC